MTDRHELQWRTSSRSGGGNCVEVAFDADLVHLRDSKDPSGPMLTVDRAAFRDFIAFVVENGASEG
jgi:hypothetical protein